MEKTNIEYFNNYLKMFVENIIETFPEFKEPLTENYGEVLGEESSSEDKHVKRFMRKMKAYLLMRVMVYNFPPIVLEF